jgi:glycosyltransferase involved in cell wall biosynthesis
LNRKIKIIIIGPENGVGGVRTHVELLLKLFKSFKFKVKVIKGNNTIKLFKTFLKIRPEIVIHNLSIFPKQILRTTINRLIMAWPNSKHIVHLHGGRFNELGFFGNSFIMKVITKTFRLYNKIFCITDEQFNLMLKFTKNKSVVAKINNYVEIPDKNAITKDNEFLNILYLGRLTAKKGILELVQVIRYLEEDKIRLWIVGDGELKNQIKKIEDPRIKFEGKKIGKEKVKYLRKADLFILFSTWPEGMPYAMLEASAYGAALISTKIGSIDKILFDGKNGYFIKAGDIKELSDVIKRFIRNPDLAHKMGNESYEICKRYFSFEILRNIYKNMFIKWYKEILKSNEIFIE